MNLKLLNFVRKASQHLAHLHRYKLRMCL